MASEPAAAPAIEDREQVAALFRAMLPHYVHERASDFRFLTQQRRVLAMLAGRGGRVLDVGCGPGLMTPALVARGWDVCGLDLLQPSVSCAREDAERAGWGRRAQYVAGDADALPFARGAFDAVIAMGVLEYLPDAARFVGEMRRVLRPGGLLVVAVPSSVAPYHLSQVFLHRFVAPAYRGARRLVKGATPHASLPEHPRRPLAPRGLDRLLASAGFRRRARAFSHFVFYPLDRLLPALSQRIDRFCSPALESSALLGWLGTQYIVAAERRRDADHGGSS
jgi:ubiquinone/menaquinone biosynthesis C-methylase UbiE